MRVTSRPTPILCLLLATAAWAQAPMKTLHPPKGGTIVYGPTDADSQARAMSAMLRSIHQEYGERPAVGRVFRVRGTNSVAVFFNVANHAQGNQPMAGMVLAAPTPGRIEAALLTDRADRLGASLNPMLTQLFGVWHPGAATGGGKGQAPAALHQVPAGDRSAVVSIPQGWQAKGQQGTMLVSGPHGESIGLDLTKQGADPRNRAPHHGMIVYPANANLVQAFPDLFQQFWRLNGASPTRLQLDRVEPVSGMPPQRAVHVTGQVNLVPSERVALDALLCTTAPTGTGLYLVMLSMAILPVNLVNQEGATAGAVMASFQPNPQVIAGEVGQMAGPMLAVIKQIGKDAQARYQATSTAHDIQNANWRKDQEIKEAQHRDWDKSEDLQERKTQGFCNYLLDQTVVQDNAENAHGTFSNNEAYTLVKLDPDRFELVDAPNYWKGIDY